MAYESKLKSDELDALFKAILTLKDEEACYRFFEDLCTIQELQAMGQRMMVAQLLHKGVTYQEVAALTGASTTTISRVNRCIHYGADGYNRVLKELADGD
jgi:TrpR-related protein YerC/YecD